MGDREARPLGFLVEAACPHAGFRRWLGSAWIRRGARGLMGKAKPLHTPGLSCHPGHPEGHLPGPQAHQPCSRLPGPDQGVERSSLLTRSPVALLADSQRHRITEEEVQQNRFHMPPLEEGECGWGGRRRGWLGWRPCLQT